MRALLFFIVVLPLLLFGCSSEQAVGDDLTSARNAYTIGHFSESERIYQHYLETRPEGGHRWEAWNRIVDISLNIYGDYEKTANLLDSMYFEFGEDSEKAWELLNRLAEVYESMRNWEEAVKTWRRALDIPALSPERAANTYLRIAKIYSYQRDYIMAQEALGACEKQAEDANMKATCLYQSAQTLEFLLRSNQAKAAGDKDNNIDVKGIQENIKSILGRIRSLEGVDQDREAMATFLLADLLESQGRRQEAREMFQTIQESYPNPKVVEARLQNLAKK